MNNNGEWSVLILSEPCEVSIEVYARVNPEVGLVERRLEFLRVDAHVETEVRGRRLKRFHTPGRRVHLG